MNSYLDSGACILLTVLVGLEVYFFFGGGEGEGKIQNEEKVKEIEAKLYQTISSFILFLFHITKCNSIQIYTK